LVQRDVGLDEAANSSGDITVMGSIASTASFSRRSTP
jgi:hypothetical protein